MNAIFRYVYSMVIAFGCIGIFSSCSNLDIEDENQNNPSNSPLGDFGEIKPLTVVTPDNQVLEDPFQVNEFNLGTDKVDEIYIFCMTTSKDHPLREFTQWTLSIKVPDLSKLKKGQSLEIYASQLCWAFSSSSGDYQPYIPNGASVLVREANDEYFDLYIDHLKYTFNSIYMGKGDYYIYGDLRFRKSDIKNPECFE